MSAVLGVVQLSLLAWTIFGLVVAAATTAVYPRLRARVRELPPEPRARLLMALAAAPLLLGWLLTASCFLPSFVSRHAGMMGDHCEHHDDHHAHFCWVHGAPSAGSAVGWILVVALSVAVVTLVVRRGLGAYRAVAAADALLYEAPPSPSARYRLLSSELPIALTVGFLKPQAIVSTGLVQTLSSRLAAAVLAHEHAHVARYDNLRKLVAGLFACLHAPRTRALLLGDLALACEQAAAAAVGDPVCVAEAIVVTKRVGALPERLSADASCFDGDATTERVERLLARNEWRDVPLFARPSVWGVVSLALASLAAAPLHEALESLVALLGS